MFNRILDVHHFHIKAIASEDNELLRLFMDYLPFETNKGLRGFGSIRSASNVICYTKNLEDFRQVRRIAGAQGWLVVNAAYTFDETLLKKYVRLNPELTLDEISPSRLLEQFGEVEANKEFQAFEMKANELLKRFGCVCRLKHFTPVDIPVIFVAEEKENVAKSANNPLAAVLGLSILPSKSHRHSLSMRITKWYRLYCKYRETINCFSMWCIYCMYSRFCKVNIR